mmetsp:Transcript_9083/g.27208  ORF Transcript_9083/g.27208 Transcript_9083/m.27208 type:complete len:99 (+) Transcript_9083:1999-2295(+)
MSSVSDSASVGAGGVFHAQAEPSRTRAPAPASAASTRVGNVQSTLILALQRLVGAIDAELVGVARACVVNLCVFEAELRFHHFHERAREQLVSNDRFR